MVGVRVAGARGSVAVPDTDRALTSFWGRDASSAGLMTSTTPDAPLRFLLSQSSLNALFHPPYHTTYIALHPRHW